MRINFRKVPGYRKLFLGTGKNKKGNVVYRIDDGFGKGKISSDGLKGKPGSKLCRRMLRNGIKAMVREKRINARRGRK